MAKKSMTYGTMPTRGEFTAAFDREVADGGFTFTLRGSDATIAHSYGLVTHAEFGPEDLYDYIEVLRVGWEEGDEKAGDIASSFMQLLGFEWV